jgi:hypothetical protein
VLGFRGALLLVAGLVACGGENPITLPGQGDGGSGASSSSGSAGSAPSQIGNAQLGNPQLTSAQSLAFGPGGVLLVGDGWSDRIVAIETGDTSIASRPFNSVEEVQNLMGAIANAFDPPVAPGEVTLLDVAVNPLSWRIYLAAQRFSGGEVAILWIDGSAAVHRFALDNVVYGAIRYPMDQPGSIVTGMAWSDPDDTILGFTGKGPFQLGQIVLRETPFFHEGGIRAATTRIYHRSHATWESSPSIDRGLLFWTDANGTARASPPGDPYVLAAYAHAPVVRFPLAAFDDGGEVTGTTVFDVGIDRFVTALAFDDRGDRGWLLATVSNLELMGGLAMVRIDRSLLVQNVNVDQTAPILFDFTGMPQVPGVDRLYFLDGVTQLDMIDAGVAVIVRGDVLETVTLPD